MTKQFYVEVAYASEHSQILTSVAVGEGYTVAQTLELASKLTSLPPIDKLALGIWSKKVSLATCVQPGDRIEIYRPLKCDPKQARRKRAQL